MKPSVYIETSVISYYTSKASKDLVTAGHQIITLDWWEKAQPKFECYISPYVMQEISKGNPEMAAKRVKAVESFSSLELSNEIDSIAQRYIKALQIPEHAIVDAYHLAISSHYDVDYLVSWNCSHIANAHMIKQLRKINETLKLPMPVICTPEELMEV